MTESRNETAERIANDCAENIDNGESREVLRAVIQWWAANAAREATYRAAAEQKLKLIKELVS